jgi:outer membrane protein OmpA-like peptidoglycan-associated protein
LAAWWVNLPKSSLTALKEGKASIYVKGYTDTVGGSSNNLSLSQQRAIKVHAYMLRFMDKIKFKAYLMHPEGLGEVPARNAGLRNNQSSPEWRRTDIFLK